MRLEAISALVLQEISERFDELLDAGVDGRVSGPLEIIRQSTGPINDYLDELDAPEIERDPFDVAARPDDRWAIGPMAFADLGAAVHDAGISWGAAKAHFHNRRHRRVE